VKETTVSKSAVRTEKYQLPATVDGICALVREVLNGGHVRRLELDNDDSFVRAHRWVEGDDLAEDEVTWDGALRNVKLMDEYYSDGATSFQVVVDMMLLAQEEGLHGTCWVIGTGGGDLLRKWFEVDERKLLVGGINTLLGLPIHRVKSLPDETLILCCSKYPSADQTEIEMAVKTTIDLRRDHDTRADQDIGGGGNHPQEHAPAANQLALTTGGLRRVAWRPSGASGHK
jgi:hypothetical protein